MYNVTKKDDVMANIWLKMYKKKCFLILKDHVTLNTTIYIYTGVGQ